MFKLVVLSALLAVAAARPSLIESHPVVYAAAPAATVAVHEPVLTKVGSVVKSIPTAVSHQSQSIVHSSAHVVQDIVAPAVRTSVVAAPATVLKTAVAPAAVQLHSAPVHHIAAAPLLHHAPVAHYSAPLTQLHVASPLTYTATGLW
ncbi:retinin-like [Rhagoletis pomonella]|uniref:retinin-like n=1 Tax=Rhagoletis pomonella TaxID=28610 RepID=UPI001786C36A|nr:retinin-like [Rhagoletis pomonella]